MSNNEDPEYVNQLGDLGIRTYILHSLMDKISRSKFEIKYLLLSQQTIPHQWPRLTADTNHFSFHNKQIAKHPDKIR